MMLVYRRHVLVSSGKERQTAVKMVLSDVLY